MKTKRNLFISITLITVVVIGTILFLSKGPSIMNATKEMEDHHQMETTAQTKENRLQAENANAESDEDTENEADPEEKEAEDESDQSEVEANESSQTGFIDVSVASLWTEPDMDRAVDAASLGDSVDMWEWTDGMSHSDKEWLIGNLQTQALYGDAVTVIEEVDGWAKVAVHGQPSPDSELGYVAWVDAEQLAYEPSFEDTLKEENEYAVVTNPTAWLYDDEEALESFMEVSYNTRLPVLKQGEGTVLVRTPSDGVKWVSADAVDVRKQDEEMADPTGDTLVESAEEFLGLPYLWAGTSGFGFDCSGFTYCVFQVNGVTIPRDSSVQATHGEAVEKDDLEKGDLLFFADDNGDGFVHHVGMYMGDGQMIHAPNTDSTVETIEVFESDYWSNEYAGARRYID